MERPGEHRFSDYHFNCERCGATREAIEQSKDKIACRADQPMEETQEQVNRLLWGSKQKIGLWTP